MPRIAQRDFSAGLVVTPPRDSGPPNSLRVARGIRTPGLARACRSRWGSFPLVDLTFTAPDARLHSLVTYEKNRYQGIGTEFRLGARLITSLHETTKLTFAEGLPVAGRGERHWLFVAGGGGRAGGNALFKVLAQSRVAEWGIAPPTTPFTAAKIAYENGVNIKVWDLFNPECAWTIAPAPNDNVQLFNSPLQPPRTSLSGGSLLAVTAHRSDAGTFSRRLSVLSANNDFAVFDYQGTDHPSSEQDWIEFDVRVDKPTNLDKLVIRFGVEDDSGGPHTMLVPDRCNPGQFIQLPDFADTYSFDVRVDDQTVRAQTLSPEGMGDVGAIRGDQSSAVQPEDTSSTTSGQPPGSQFTRQTLESIAITTISSSKNVWTRLRIPKSSFTRGRFDNPNDWKSLSGVSFTIHTNDGPDQSPSLPEVSDFQESFRGCAVWLANGVMIGGTGMQGDYTYRRTFLNSDTGHRSNANTSGPVIVKDVPRTGVRLSGLDPSPDPQVKEQEIWRSVGNGSVWFRLPQPRNIHTDTFDDHTADFHAMHDLKDPNRPFVLSNEELPFDNVQPEKGFSHVAGPHLGQLFWTRDTASGHDGRWYFSPIGRLESVAGFLELGSHTDPMQATVIWNGTVYACSIEQWWEMQGQGAQWVGRPVFGVPGTRYPFTVVATPYGIPYLAEDGVRLFNGNSSALVGADRVLVRFRGEVTDALAPPFPSPADNDPELVAAAFHNDEYFLTDGQSTLAVDLRTGAWREVGVPFSALYREAEGSMGVDNLLVVGVEHVVLSWEQPGRVTDNGNPIPFVIATPALVPDAGIVATVSQRLYVDCNTRGQILFATIYETDDVSALQGGPFPVQTGQGRETVEIALGAPIGAGYVTIMGNLVNVVDINAIELDLHRPEQPGQGT